jgi:hypothetical protein
MIHCHDKNEGNVIKTSIGRRITVILSKRYIFVSRSISISITNEIVSSADRSHGHVSPWVYHNKQIIVGQTVCFTCLCHHVPTTMTPFADTQRPAWYMAVINTAYDWSLQGRPNTRFACDRANKNFLHFFFDYSLC